MCEIYIYIKFTHTHAHTHTHSHTRAQTHTHNKSKLAWQMSPILSPPKCIFKDFVQPLFWAKTCLLFPHAPPVLARRAHFSDAPPLMSRPTQRAPPAFQGTPSIKRAPPLSCKARRASTTRPLLSQTRPCIPVLHIRTVLDAANSSLIIHISTWSRNM